MASTLGAEVRVAEKKMKDSSTVFCKEQFWGGDSLQITVSFNVVTYKEYCIQVHSAYIFNSKYFIYYTLGSSPMKAKYKEHWKMEGILYFTTQFIHPDFSHCVCVCV
jgi:hypothetical protein